MPLDRRGEASEEQMRGVQDALRSMGLALDEFGTILAKVICGFEETAQGMGQLAIQISHLRSHL